MRFTVWATSMWLFSQALAACSVGVYYSQAAWQTAMMQQTGSSLTAIGFNGTQWSSMMLYTPASTTLVSQSSASAGNGMSVSVDSGFGAQGWADPSTLGHVANGAWTDTISKYGSTSFNFSEPIYGFGGDFSIAGSNGLYIGGLGDVGTGSGGYDGFIGYVFKQPVGSLLLSYGDGGFGNTYTERP